MAQGEWAAAEAWLNRELALAWRLRGPHPRHRPVLEAAGLRMGTSQISLSQTDPAFADDPWRAAGRVLEGRTKPPAGRFAADIDAFASQWVGLVNDKVRYGLAKVLSRIALTPAQALRWWDRAKRSDTAGRALGDDAIIENPYLVCELDRGGGAVSSPVSFPATDRAVLVNAFEHYGVPG